MSDLKKLIRAVKADLPITQRHDQWLSRNANPVYSAEALKLAQQALSGEVGGQRTRTTLFRSSATGMCQRRRIFAAQHQKEAETIEPALANIFHTGSMLHLKWQMAGLTAGWLDKAEIAYEREDLNFGGTLDGLLFDGTGFEFKTINHYGYRMVMDKGPKDLHILQVHSYMVLEPEIKAFSIVYENKDNGEWREYRVRRLQSLVDEITEELTELNDHVQASTLPRMLPNCKRGEGAEFRNCPFKDVCVMAR